MRTLQLILFFLFFSPGQGEDQFRQSENENPKDQDRIIRADSPTIVELAHLSSLKPPVEKENKAFDKKIKGFGWLPEQNFSFDSACITTHSGINTGSEIPLICDKLLKQCYRSKSNPSPAATA